MRSVHRRPPRRLARQFLVWFVWFILSGYVFHNRTERDLHELSIPGITLRLGSLFVVLISAYWVFEVMPTRIRTYLMLSGLLGISLGLVPVLVQTGVTKYLEIRQVWLNKDTVDDR